MEAFIGYSAAITTIILLIITVVSVIKGAPFVGTSAKSVKRMVDLAGTLKGKIMADLGSGDGRVVIEFARSGAIAHGFEINPFLAILSKIRIRRLGLQKKAHIHWSNYWRSSFKEFDIVTLYGINYIMAALEEKLQKELRSGARVVTYVYKFPYWKMTAESGCVYLYQR